MSGWIKIHRKMREWEWFTEPLTAHVFLYLLLQANHEGKRWRGVKVDRGQICTGIRAISKHTGVSVRSVRTALNHLKSTHELTLETTHRYTMITICNYERYQDYGMESDTQNDTQIDKPATQQRHSSDTIKELKKLKELKEDKNTLKRVPKPKFNPTGKRKFLDHVYLTDDQYEEVKQYYTKQGYGPDVFKEAVSVLDSWFEDNPAMRQKRVNDAKTLKGWPLQRALEKLSAERKYQKWGE